MRRSRSSQARPLRDRIEEAWQSIKAGLITGVSVGYRVLDGGLQILKNGGRRFTQTEICELSLVTVPANMHATIDVIKSLDAAFLAASGPITSGVSERSHVPARKGAVRMTTQEQITQFENSRAAKVARMAAIMADANDATLPDDKREEYDGLSLEVKATDDHLVRARELEKLMAGSATRIVPAPGQGGPVSGAVPVVRVKANCRSGPRLSAPRSLSAKATSATPPSTRNAGRIRRPKSRCI
jgi:hypothetical protein